MPSLLRALAFRLFGTKRLAAASACRLAGLVLFVYTLPGVLLAFGWLAYTIAFYAFASGVLYVFTLIVPLLALGLLFGLLPWLCVLFVRGYSRIARYYCAWFRQTYRLAQEDVCLNALFAGENS